MGTAKTGLPQSLEFGQYFLVKAGKAVIFVTVGTPVSYTHLDVYKRQQLSDPQTPL